MRFTVVFLLVVAAASYAQDKTPDPDWPEPAADMVLAAFKAEDSEALKALAGKDDPDPWLVADLLCYRGEHDAAEAFAKAAPRVDTEKLPAYVEAWRKREPDKADRALLAAMNVNMRARRHQEIVEGTAALPAMDTVTRVRVRHSRGMALRWTRRPGESAKVLHEAADAAVALGWLARASQLYLEAGVSARVASAAARAMASLEKGLALSKRRGDKRTAGATLGQIGNVHFYSGDHAKALRIYVQALAEQKAAGDRRSAAITLLYMGLVCRNLGDHAKALSHLEQALPVLQALGDKQGVALTLAHIGGAHQGLGDYAKALGFLERGLASARESGQRPMAADTLTTIGDVQMRLGNYQKALAALEQALAEQKALFNLRGAAAALLSIGHVHVYLGNHAKALASLQQAQAQFEAMGDKRGATLALAGIGNVHFQLGDYAKALAIYEQALAGQKALGDRRGAASTLLTIGNVHARVGDSQKALATYEQALTRYEALGDKRAATLTLVGIGGVHAGLGDHRKALATFEHALAEQRALGDKQGAAQTLGNIGGVHTRLGDYQRALSTLEQARGEHTALGDKTGAAGVLGNIGIVYQILGDYATALATFEQALAEHKALGGKHAAAVVLGNIGVIHGQLGDHEKALAIYEQALAEKKAMGDKHGAAITLGSIGLVHRRLGDDQKALAIYEQALAEQRALGAKHVAAATLGNIASVHGALGDDEKALAIYEQALAERRALGDRRGVAGALGNIGAVRMRLGDDKKALAALKRSAEEARSLRATPLFVFAQRSLAQLHLQTGKPARAVAAAQKALDALEGVLGGLGEEQGATAREQYASLFGIGTLAAVREQDAAEAVKFLESGRAGALLDALDKREALRWKADSLSPELRRLDLDAQAKARVARRAYDAAVKTGKRKEVRAAAASLDDATNNVRAVAGRIQRALKQQAGLFYPRPKTIYAIQEALEKDQALVLYGFFRDEDADLDEALALVLRSDGERVVSLGKASDVAAACQALDATDPKRDPKLGVLRELLVDPLELGDDVKQVLLSPEGPLCYVPFGALFAQPVAMAPSGTTHVLLLGEERAKGEGILALGDPDYKGASKGAQAIYYRGRTLSPLPATRKEAEAIGTTTLLGAKASEAGLYKALPTAKRWRAVHFGCHGLVNVEQPMLSSLALAREGDEDGFLTALEVLRIKIPADLAVLSACETARGKIVKGEGIVGLTRAFMFAGTPRVICSLWKVDDEATQALMVKFYELWKTQPTATALKNAQAFVRSHDKWKHPYYWAAWQLWGLPN